jgi:hypothetical protein
MADDPMSMDIDRLRMMCLFAGWAASWVNGDEGRLTSMLAWLEQNPQLTGGLGGVTKDVLGGGLELYVQELDIIFVLLSGDHG